MQVVLDIETLDTKETAVILSIGAVKFDPMKDGYQAFEVKIDTNQPGRTVSASTVEWWDLPQNAAAKADLDKGLKVSLRDALGKLAVFMYGANQVWACDPDFDLKILSNAYEQDGTKTPYKYSSGRSIRTIEDLFFGGCQRNKGGLFYQNDLKHNALSDCILEMRVVKAVYDILSKCSIAGEEACSYLDAFEDNVSRLG